MIKKLFKAFTVAFSVYSKIPMPRFEWQSEDMELSMGMFPLVGAVIGLLEWGWYLLCRYIDAPIILQITLAVAIPLMLTGGIHMDGFMDTCDAIHSYQPREKKLEILKDPHIGAFAVINLVVYLLIAVGMLSLLQSEGIIAAACVNFTLARCFSGFSVVTMKSVKNDGMLHTFATNSAKNLVIGILIFEAILAMLVLGLVEWKLIIPLVTVDLLVYLHYGQMSKRQFGGITGDLAGYFLCLAELMVIIVLAVISII